MQFILTVEGPNMEDIESIELPRLPMAGEPIETNFGTCIVVSTTQSAAGGQYDGTIVCRMP